MQQETAYGSLFNDSIARNLKNVPALALHRFLAKIQIQENGCWIWMGRQEDGHGIFYPPEGCGLKASYRAHRFAYEMAIGPIPWGHDVHHKCRNRRCVRPHSEHLEPLTPEDHAIEEAKARKLRTHCIRGHVFTEDNIVLSKRGKRKCRQCDLDNKREKYREAFGDAPPQTACEQGHPFDEANTYWYVSTGGYRARGCRICRNEGRRRATIKKKQEVIGKLADIRPKTERCMHGHEYAATGYSVSRTGQIRCSQCLRDRANARNAAHRATLPPREERTECVNGHDLSDGNAVRNNKGVLCCRECARARSLAYVERRNQRLAEHGLKHVQATRTKKPPKTHCPLGHPYTDSGHGTGRKHCPTCFHDKIMAKVRERINAQPTTPPSPSQHHPEGA